MLTGQVPFADVGALAKFCNNEILFSAILSIEAVTSRLIVEFIETILQAEPVARPTAEEAAFLLSRRCNPGSAQLHESGENQHLYFRDCIDRDFKFPWESCSTWADMKFNIHLALSYIEHIYEQVLEENYDLLFAEEEVIDREKWVQRVRPGMQVLMRLRPKHTHGRQSLSKLLAKSGAQHTRARNPQSETTIEAAALLSDKRSGNRTTPHKHGARAELHSQSSAAAPGPPTGDRLVVPTVDTHLMTLLGSWSQEDQWSTLMPLAKENLRGFLRTAEPLPIGIARSFCGFWAR